MLTKLKMRKGSNTFSPDISIKKRHRKLVISGSSRMADPAEYYTLLTHDLEGYFHSFNKNLIIEFCFDYINTGSSKWLYFTFTQLEKLQLKGGMIEVFWKYEQDDETIEESGEIFQSLVSFPFRLIPT